MWYVSGADFTVIPRWPMEPVHTTGVLLFATIWITKSNYYVGKGVTGECVRMCMWFATRHVTQRMLEGVSEPAYPASCWTQHIYDCKMRLAPCIAIHNIIRFHVLTWRLHTNRSQLYSYREGNIELKCVCLLHTKTTTRVEMGYSLTVV